MDENTLSPVDVAIVGAGPAGMSAAINVVARGKSVYLISAGQSNLEKAEIVDNYLGIPNVDGTAIMKEFEQHLRKQNITINKGRVSNILPFGEQFMLNIGQPNGVSTILEAGAVVITVGAARGRAIPGETELLGRGVSYCGTCDGMLYRNKNAVVWGMSEDSIREANFLTEIGVRVTYIARGEKPDELDVDKYISGAIKEIKGNKSVSSVVTRDNETIEVDAVFVLRDAIAPSALIGGLELEDRYIKIDRMCQTNIKGLFAAGDCTGQPLQLANAVGEGLIAGQQAARFSG